MDLMLVAAGAVTGLLVGMTGVGSGALGAVMRTSIRFASHRPA